MEIRIDCYIHIMGIMQITMCFNVIVSFLTMNILFGKITEGKLNSIYMHECKENVFDNFYLFSTQRKEMRLLNNPNVVN